MLQPYIAATGTVTVLAGGFVTLLAFRAYRRTCAPALRALSVGLGLVTVGTLLAGVVHQLARTELARTGVATAVAVQSTATAVGFAVLAYSLYADGPAAESEADYST